MKDENMLWLGLIINLAKNKTLGIFASVYANYIQQFRLWLNKIIIDCFPLHLILLQIGSLHEK